MAGGAEASAAGIAPGSVLGPAGLADLARAGATTARVHRRPLVRIGGLAAPSGTAGHDPAATARQRAARAVVSGWCAVHGLTPVVGDDLAPALDTSAPDADGLVVLGGADATAALDHHGWTPATAQVSLAPEAIVAAGLLAGRPVVVLPEPTDDPAHATTTLGLGALALPVLRVLAGHRHPDLPRVQAVLGAPVDGAHRDGRLGVGRLRPHGATTVLEPHSARAASEDPGQLDALVEAPEGTVDLPRGAAVHVTPLAPPPPGPPPSGRPAADGAPATVAGTTASDGPQPPTVSVVARSGTGKTTLLERLLPELTARGLRVGVVKHHAHPTPFDLPRKDTYRLEQAGAAVVVGACPVQVAVFRQEDGSADLDAVIATHLAEMDLVLVEGFKRGAHPKIELHREALASGLLCDPDELLAVVTDVTLPTPVTALGWDDVTAAADLLERWLGRGTT